jgi:hypothetical protein
MSQSSTPSFYNVYIWFHLACYIIEPGIGYSTGGYDGLLPVEPNTHDGKHVVLLSVQFVDWNPEVCGPKWLVQCSQWDRHQAIACSRDWIQAVQSNDAKSSVMRPGSKISVQVINSNYLYKFGYVEQNLLGRLRKVWFFIKLIFLSSEKF